MLTWSYNKTDEIWQHDEFATVEECIVDAKENYGMKQGEQIVIGTVYPYIVCVDVDSMLERIEENAYEEYGDVAEDWEISSRKYHEKETDELQEKVNLLVDEYLDKIQERPTFTKIDNIYTITLN